MSSSDLNIGGNATGATKSPVKKNFLTLNFQGQDTKSFLLCGGVGAGAVPLAQILAGITGDADKDVLALLMPAVALGNAVSIIAAGLLDKLGKVIPKWSGNGELVNTTQLNTSFKGNKTYGECTVLKMGVGFLICYVFYTLGIGMSKVIGIHGYACTIILAGAANILRIVPEHIEEAIYHWYQFIIKVGIPASLILVGIAVMNMSNVIAAFTNCSSSYCAS